MAVHISKNLSALAVAALVVLLAASPAAHAASGTWNSDSAGNWSDTTKWSGGTVADGFDQTATFSNVITAARIVTLDTPRTIGHITASDTTHDYTISGANTLTLDVTAGSPIINVTQSGRTLTIGSVIAGNDGLQKSGAGILTLSVGNSYSGGSTINGGTLTIATASALGTSANVTFTGTGTLTGNAAITYTLGDLTINSGFTGTVSGSTNRNYNFGTLTGSGTLAFTGVAGSPVLTVTDASTFTGAIQLGSTSAGTNSISVPNLSDAIGSGKIQLVNGSFGQTQAFRLAGTAALTLNNRQFEIVSGNASTVFSIENNSADMAHTLVINTDFSAGPSLTAKRLQFGGSNPGDNAFAGVIPNTTGGGVVGVTKAGGGKWILGNTANTYTGTTTIPQFGGILEVKSLADGGMPSSIGASSNAASNLVFGGRSMTLRYTGSGHSTDRLFTMSSASNGSGNYTIDSSGTGPINFTNTGAIVQTGNFTGTRTLLLTGTNTGNNTFAPSYTNFIFSGTQLGAVNKSGIGTWVLSGANTYTGITTINAGILQFANQASLYNNTPASWTAANINVKNTGTLAFNVGGVGEFTAGDITTLLTNLANSTSTTNGMNAGSAFGFDTTNAAGGTFTIANLIANSGGGSGGARGLTKLGTGTLVLTNANTYTGPTTVNDGTLLVNGSLAAGSAVTVNSGATLGGTGTVNGTVNINAGGFLAPGNSIGTMNVGPLTISGTENMELGLPGTVALPGLSDRTNVTGALTLNGGSTLNLIDNFGNDGNGFLGAGRYQLMTYTTTLSGTFTNVTGLPSTHLANVIYSGPGIAAADGVLLDLFDHGQASLSGGGVVMNTATDFTLNFGTVNQNSAQIAALLLENLINTLGFTAGIDLDSLAETGDDAALNTGIFTNDLLPFANLAANANTMFNVEFDTSTVGAFAADYLFTFSDADGLLGSGPLPSLTLHVLGQVEAEEVPEPAAVAMWSVIGLCLAGYGARHVRRRRVT